MGVKRYDRAPIEVLIPENRQEMDEVQRRVVELKNLFRNARDSKDNVIIADRASFKTTALVQFVAERMMNLEPPARVGVLCPNSAMVEQFARAYQIEFPTLRVRNPLVASYNEICTRGGWRGGEVVEIYAEEIFMMHPSVMDLPEFVFGVGTLEKRPVSARIRNW